jgi:hypothetical protein
MALADLGVTLFWNEYERLMEKAFKETNMARNRVDEVLGFEAPRWLDEVFSKRRIDRQKADKTEIEAALHDVVNVERNRLRSALYDAARAADVLGMKVIAEDLRTSAVQASRTSTDLKKFFSQRSDPRVDL